MFELNATLPIFILSFLIFMYLLNEIMLKPVGRVLEARAARINSNIEAGKNAHAEAEKSLKHYQEHLHKVRSEAQGIINTAVEEANKKRNQEFDKLRQTSKTKLDAAKAEIAAERTILIDSLVAQETALVQEITDKLIGEKTNVSFDTGVVRKALEEAC
jgi:F-type H+-transporting ATPase subunit b